jgi:hypothetical protein
MTLQLYFNPALFPRTITRKEWKKIWRWKRITQKRLAEEFEQQRLNLIMFGTTHPDIKADMLDRMINPPLLIHDRMKI